MKLVKPSFEIIEQPPKIEGVYKMIELAGRTCYKSENTITEDSAKDFVERMINNNHLAMLEHGTIYLTTEDESLMEKYDYNPYSKVYAKDGIFYITTNYRVIIENHWEYDLDFMTAPTANHWRRITVKFILNRQIANEFVRHRVFSFAQESTRYNNYSKDKFNNKLTFIIPNWLDIPIGEYYLWDGDWCDANNQRIPLLTDKYKETEYFLCALHNAEDYYMTLINLGWKPQQAANVLPNALKTELIMTGFETDWKHFFNLRSDIASTGKPHPQAEELATPLLKEFKNREYL